MTTLTLPAPAPIEQDGPRPLRWTWDQYYRLAEDGYFDGKRVMLIDGEIVVMSPIGEPHAQGVVLTHLALQAAFGSHFTLRTQSPFRIARTSDPEPDVAVIPGAPRAQPRTPPTAAALIVEVADTSLSYDTGAKASLYAAGGIADYWVVDLVHNRLVVFRDPRPDAAAAHGHSYFARTQHEPADAVAPLAAPHHAVRVADLLP